AGIIIVATALNTTCESGMTNTSHAIAMGLAYGVGAAISYPVTGAALNPARATGIAIFAQNQGLSQEPLQQLWVFWICPILAAAIVSLVAIVASMIGTKKNVSEAEQDSETLEAIADDASDDADGHEGEQDEQSDAQTDADESVEAN
uniref:aquaporin n=1 Tax=Bifidobacterium adolescentis TaxID=1680 RepID=UPI0040260329